MESSHIATLHLPGLSKQARQTHIIPKMKTAPLISLGVLCDYGCTITLDSQETSFQKNGQKIIKVTRNKQTGMWEVLLETQLSEVVANTILEQTTKPELAQYIHAALFRPTSAILLNEIKQGLLKNWTGLT